MPRKGRATLASRQILVTHVGAASPADRVVMVDDVILGVDGKPFSDDARKSIALAIQEAETEARGGALKLMVWRAGQVRDLVLKLAVMGTSPNRTLAPSGRRSAAKTPLAHQP